MPNQYPMTISRLTVDKLGVKLYDRVSAVIAELVSNGYDADATEVVIEAPMGEYLASRAGDVATDKGRTIRVTDNGIGMTPKEAVDYYLKVGAERRQDSRRGRGDVSPRFNRRVMGRKGVGKLAPFGICQVIEVITSGGDEITRCNGDHKQETGYLTAHFILNRRGILKDTDDVYYGEVGDLDNTLRPTTGTTIILKAFAYRRVSKPETFVRQLSQRFGLSTQDWRIKTRNTLVSPTDSEYETVVGAFEVETMENSTIRLQGPPGLHFSLGDDEQYHVIDAKGTPIAELSAGFRYDGRFYPVVGWMAYAKEPYRDELMVGVRIYCRGKIAAQTAVFNQRAGFHGEHDIRSYMVGELHADWLDEDEDLIQTDRRDILWSHELGQQFQDLGQSLVKKIGNISRDPMRKKIWEDFLETGRVDERIANEFPDPQQEAIRDNAKELARLLGQTMRREEARDAAVVETMIQLALTLAPHVTLDKKLREAADSANTPMDVISGILRTARVAELSSFGRIAEDRLKVIRRVRSLKDDPDTAERKLQDLITYAPWLINPQWAPITANQSFATLRLEFEKFYEKQTGEAIVLGEFVETGRRPDFVLSSQDNGLQIIEIKRPTHNLTNDEMDRIIKYHDAMKAFLNSSGNSEFRYIFRSFHITLVCDGVSLTGAQALSFDKFVGDNMMTHINWAIFLLRTEQMHQDFLKEAKRQKRVFGD